MPSEEETKMAYQAYEFIREKVVHEDNLVNQRVTWLITFTGFLFAAFGLSVSDATPNPSADSLRLGLFFAGFSSSIAAYIGISAAYICMRQDRNRYYNFIADKTFQELPNLCAQNSTNRAGMVCGLLVPIITGIAWAVLSIDSILSASNYIKCFLVATLLAGIGVYIAGLWMIWRKPK